MRQSFTCDIAGLYYRKDKLESGRYDGYTKPEPENEHDSNAVAIYIADGTFVGYIPKGDKNRFLYWGQGERSFKCVVRLDIEKQWDRYDGYITIVRDVDETTALNGKKISVVGDNGLFKNDDIKDVLRSYGAIIGTSRPNKQTDFVAYNASIDPAILELSKQEGYHFQVSNIFEILKLAVQNKPHNEFFGKKVSIAGGFDSYRGVFGYNELLFFLLESGAEIVNFTKKNTDIVIDDKGYQRQMSRKAEEYGKPIVFFQDIALREVDESLLIDENEEPKTSSLRQTQVRTTQSEGVKNNAGGDYKFILSAVFAVIAFLLVMFLFLK